MEKFLVTGADTLLGANLALALRDRYCVTTVGADDAPTIGGCSSIVCDLNDPADVAYQVAAAAPAGVIHCGARARAAWDLSYLSQTIDTEREVQQASSCVAAADRAGAPVAVLLTDAVFSGPRMFHTESSPATAGHAWAAAAKTLERALAASSALVIRTHAYGWAVEGAESSFAEIVYQNLSSGVGCPVDAQNYATPILATDLAPLVCAALARRSRGILHLAGAERANQYRFAAEMAVAFGLTGRQVLLEPPQRRFSPRPFMDETSLNTGTARRELRAALPMLREGLARFAEQAVNGFREELRAAYRPAPRCAPAQAA